jgi:hypothetical protein
MEPADQSGTPESMTGLLWPLSVDDFLATTYGRTHCHVPGKPDRFEPLFSWRDLNRALEQHRLDHKRCRLVRGASGLDPESFRTPTRNRRGDTIERLRPSGLMAHLRDGATLVLDSVHELCEPLTALAESLGRVLHEPVEINAYASWGGHPGYGPHFDNHDVFVAQIAGRKSWQIYPPGCPEAGPEHDGAERAPPEFQQVIHAGDLLYIPHGRVHEAIGVSDPSLHLSIGVAKRRGIDLLEWTLRQLREDTLFNRDLPRFADPEERGRHMAELWQRLARAWQGDPLARYFEDMDASAPMYPHFGLPWIGEPLELPRDGDRRIRSSGIIWCVSENGDRNDDELEFRVAGETVKLPKGSRELLRPLLAGHAVELQQLCRRPGNAQSEHDALSVVNDLLGNGILHIAG